MVWTDLNGAGHGEIDFTVFLNQVGENPKFASAGEWSRVEAGAMASGWSSAVARAINL
jgi:hypothetical protein